MDLRSRTFTTRIAGVAFAGLVASTLAITTADAQNLRYALGLPESNYNFDAAQMFAADVRENTGININVFALSLLNLNEIPGGVRDGLTDIGFTLFPYFPAEFAEVNLPANLAQLAATGTPADNPGAAFVGAMTEYVMLHCDNCQQEMRNRNAVYISGAAAVDFALMCSSPVATLDDLRGKTVRTGTADHSRFVEYFGGIAIAMSGNETYDALNTGNLDCTASVPENLLSLRFAEVTSHVTLMAPPGMFAGIGSANMNRDTWARLTEEQRRGVLNAGARMGLNIVNLNLLTNQSGIDLFLEGGGTTFELPEEDRTRVSEFVEQDIPSIERIFTETYGLQNVSEKIETITDLVEKWKGLTNGSDMDVDAFADLFIEHIYSKVDVSTYGIN